MLLTIVEIFAGPSAIAQGGSSQETRIEESGKT
jgi:hypothetical protein